MEGLQQAKKARSAPRDECLSADVYEFSSLAVKPSHGFTISSLTLEFEYLVGGWLQDGNVSLGIGIGGIVVHSRILVDNPNGSAYGGHETNFGFCALSATELAVETPIGWQQVNLDEGLQCPAPRLVLSWFPRKSKSENGGRSICPTMCR